jgi:hypothetical protein
MHFIAVLAIWHTLLFCGVAFDTNPTNPPGRLRPSCQAKSNSKAELLEDGLRVLQLSLKQNAAKLARLQQHVKATSRQVEKVLNASAGRLHIPRIIHRPFTNRGKPTTCRPSFSAGTHRGERSTQTGR